MVSNWIGYRGIVFPLLLKIPNYIGVIRNENNVICFLYNYGYFFNFNYKESKKI